MLHAGDAQAELRARLLAGLVKMVYTVEPSADCVVRGAVYKPWALVKGGESGLSAAEDRPFLQEAGRSVGPARISVVTYVVP